MSIDDIKAAFKRRRVEARVLLDGSLLDEHTQLESALSKALLEDVEHNRTPEAPAIKDRLRELEQRIETEQKVFAFEGVGQYRWQNLAADNPPTKEQRAQGWDVNIERLAPEAISQSCVDPVLTVEDAEWLMLNLDVAEWDRLWGACLKANVGERDRPKSWTVTEAVTARNGYSTTAPPEESLAQSS